MTTPPTQPAPAKTRPACVPVPLLAAIPEVVREMDTRWRKLQRTRDWRAVFAKSYLRTTEQILAAAGAGGTFENPAWMVHLDCDFAGRYFTAIDCWEAG